VCSVFLCCFMSAIDAAEETNTTANLGTDKEQCSAKQKSYAPGGTIKHAKSRQTWVGIVQQ